MLGTDPALVDLFRLYGAGPIDRLWKLRLPYALPSIVTGLRVAAHWYTSQKGDWYELPDDGMPRHERSAAAESDRPAGA